MSSQPPPNQSSSSPSPAIPAGPNPLSAAISMLRARRVRTPSQFGHAQVDDARAVAPQVDQAQVDHAALASILEALRADGVAVLGDHRNALAAYRDSLAAVDPETLGRDEALAYWINLYNAGALDLAAEAANRIEVTVLRVAGGFRRPWATVGGEELSIDDIEHGKIRRFRDPRIHGGLVCGSASCPTLRYEPFRGADIDEQLEDQMKSFLAGGGAIQDISSGRLMLSRIFLWYGADFTRPNRMPTLLPARKAAIADALGRWLPPEIESWRVTAGPPVAFQPYDWSLACTIR